MPALKPAPRATDHSCFESIAESIRRYDKPLVIIEDDEDYPEVRHAIGHRSSPCLCTLPRRPLASRPLTSQLRQLRRRPGPATSPQPAHG